jgi:hypothetical protein
MFVLGPGLKAEWIDTDLPDNTARWRSKYFYVADQIPSLHIILAISRRRLASGI